MHRPIALFVASLTILGCADSASSDKPASDPDLAFVAGKADNVSDYWTDIRGELAIGTRIIESIDFPSFYLGRTVELRAGQRFQVDLVTNRKSLVRIYGPATGSFDGLPTFGASLVRADTRKVSGKQTSSFAFDVPANGTYMLVYGPKNVWAANYQIDVTCLAGCVAADACEGDYDCKAGEFCGDNGVRCIQAPCEANYNVCRSKVGDGSSCSRDGECAAGFACREGVCDAQVCETETDCINGFCGCADSSCRTRICKDFAKEGERCGGFRIADRVRFCSKDFACVAPYDIIADIPGHCGEMTTVAEITADPAGFDGRFVAIKGVVDPNSPHCTKIGCSDSNMCCNQCSATLRVYDNRAEFGTEGIYLSEAGTSLGCAGNECNVRGTCALAPGNYWVAGWFHLDGGVTPRLDIVARYAY